MSLHAGVYIPGTDRKRLERVCRYTGRPALAVDRLSRLPDGRIRYEFRHPWRDGTSHIILDPAELMARLASLIPPARQHQVRYYGILAPAAAWRDQVVPQAEAIDPRSAADKRVARRSWAELLRRVFALDVLECRRCGGQTRVLSVALREPVARAMLVGPSAGERGPPRPRTGRGYGDC